MTTKLSISVCLLSLVAQGYASYPPVLWARTYFEGYGSTFHDVHETNDGSFIATVESSIDPQFPICLFDADGDTIWTGTSEMDYVSGCWVEELDDGSFVVTGRCREIPYSEPGLFLAKYSAAGELEWNRIHRKTESDAYGYCVLPLPDNGFAVCGELDPDSGMDQAWLLRVDAEGDTLWTREWGWIYNDRAMRVLFVDNALTVLIHGRLESTSGGPHMVRYDLNGNLLWEKSFPELYGRIGQDMCYSPVDGGYTLITYDDALIVHTDPFGNILWMVSIPGTWANYGLSINSTMDGGYIWGGHNRWIHSDSVWSHSGRLAKVTWNGVVEWTRSFAQVSCEETNSVRQLSQGGYIVAGFNKYDDGALARFGPETGIEEGITLPLSVSLHQPTPNPFTSSLSVGYSLPESRHVSLSVYDLSGRRVGELEDSVLEAGEHTSTWNPGELPSGCYIVMLRAGDISSTETCVLAR